MNINVDIYDDNVEIEQSDIENMWNYLMDDPDNLIYLVSGYLESIDLEYYEDQLRPLYEKLKKHYSING